MPARAESRGPLARLTLAAGALLVLLAVVAIASRSGLGGGGRQAEPDQVLLDRLFTAFLVLFLLYIPLAAWIYWTQRHTIRAELAKKQRRSTLRSLVTLAVVLLSVLAIVRLREQLGLHHPFQGRVVPAKTTKAKHGRDPSQGYSPHFDTWVALVVGGLVVAAGAAGVAIVRGSRTRSGADGLSVGERLSLALDDSIEDVLSERDPRRAVIAAYVRMERELAAAGIPRAPHEAPFEYVDRALRALDVGEASLQRLTELYEQARFSTHEIDEAMRGAAIAALAEVRDELRAEKAA